MAEPLTLAELLQITETVDAYLDSHRSPEYIEQSLANDWARVTKVCEEAGEVWAALSKRTGENYRKGVCGTETELLGELADCVSAAMCAIQHRTKNAKATWAVVSAAFAKAHQRVVDAAEHERTPA
jgi:phosphoribosyl-ATP pyrophosphohydrolase